MKAHRPLALVLILAASLGAQSCGCGGAVQRPYAPVKTNEVVSALTARNQSVSSFRAESTMDYRVGDERVKGTVLIAGKRGSRIRFNAENPGGSVAVDLACNGRDFVYVNNNDDCRLTGPCTQDAIAQLLRVRLEPDQFMLLAIGSVPILDFEKSETKWLDDKGRERITLTARDGRKQIIELSGQKDRRWDVMFAKQLDENGKIEWKVRNKDFRTIRSADGRNIRAPGKTLFEQPSIKSDLLVEWKKRTLGVELPDPMFEMEIPEGLRRCGAK